MVSVSRVISTPTTATGSATTCPPDEGGPTFACDTVGTVCATNANHVSPRKRRTRRYGIAIHILRRHRLTTQFTWRCHWGDVISRKPVSQTRPITSSGSLLGCLLAE